MDPKSVFARAMRGVPEVGKDDVEKAPMEAMIHIAALVGPYFPTDAYERVNVKGTRNVIDACKEFGVHALVDCSSPSTRFDGNDIRGSSESEVWKAVGEQYRGVHEYATTKARGEQMVLE